MKNARLASELSWFSKNRSAPRFKHFASRPIAYFCAEYAIAPNIPTYSGGLGILAGDVAREAADRGVALMAIGLFYREGYACGVDDGIKSCPRVNPEDTGCIPVLDKNGKRLKIKIPIQDEYISVQAWELKQKQNSIFFLDTDCKENKPSDQKITNRLYVADKELRFKQEIVLGIGGLRLLRALDIHPSVYHLNEGHSALLSYELIRHEMQERNLAFDEAIQFARRRLVFTNHTLVPAGNELYSDDLASLLLSKYSEDLNTPVSSLVKLGLVQESSVFSLTMLSLRMAGISNAVSKEHAKRAREIWRDHPMAGITNGIHIPSWDRIKNSEENDESFWLAHQKNKNKLLKYVKKETGQVWQDDDLLVGWARRITSYKRPLSPFADLPGLKQIIKNSKRPVKFIFAGIPHLSDHDGLAMLEKLKLLTREELSGDAVYLNDYNMESSKLLVAGCDVWLNTPIVGMEACGTSGMKAALNGVLPVSTNDGWMAEINPLNVGWLLDSDNVTESFLLTLKENIIPLYCRREAKNMPELWIKNMRHARELVQNEFSATRMLRQYIETLYW